jgi:membrane protease subunit HflK
LDKLTSQVQGSSAAPSAAAPGTNAPPVPDATTPDIRSRESMRNRDRDIR